MVNFSSHEKKKQQQKRETKKKSDEVTRRMTSKVAINVSKKYVLLSKIIFNK